MINIGTYNPDEDFLAGWSCAIDDDRTLYLEVFKCGQVSIVQSTRLGLQSKPLGISAEALLALDALIQKAMQEESFINALPERYRSYIGRFAP